AAAAQQTFETLTAQAIALNTQLAARRTKVIQYQQLLGKFRSAADLQQRIDRDQTRAAQLTASLKKLEHAHQVDAYLQSQAAAVAQQKAELASLGNAIGAAQSVGEIMAQARYYENYLAQLKSDLEAVEEARTL